jgi:membrane-bound lytic murein transglycosylase C
MQGNATPCILFYFVTFAIGLSPFPPFGRALSFLGDRLSVMFMKQILVYSLICLHLVSLSSCSTREIISVTTATISGDIMAPGRLVLRKGVYYVSHPQVVAARLKEFAGMLERFRKAVTPEWGEKETKEPTPTTYVKYTQNYKARAWVDFDKGIVTVETVDDKDPESSLREAIVTVLLTPNDPRGVDLYSDRSVVLGETPFLYNEVLDRDGKPIRWEWRANRFADVLVSEKMQSRKITAQGHRRTVHYVNIPMVKDHLMVRARKFRPHVLECARLYKVSPNLIYAIMKTESDFNPFAVSHVPAYGLMQIVPATAGQDVSGFLGDSQGVPSRDFLFEPGNNIRYGAVYLHILNYKYLAKITDPVSREYCVIAAYNGGAGSVLKTFSRDRDRAPEKINRMHPGDVYRTLVADLPARETRRYVQKVVSAKKEFVKL